MWHADAIYYIHIIIAVVLCAGPLVPRIILPWSQYVYPITLAGWIVNNHNCWLTQFENYLRSSKDSREPGFIQTLLTRVGLNLPPPVLTIISYIIVSINWYYVRRKLLYT